MTESSSDAVSPGDETFAVAYLLLSGTTTAARCPELLRGLRGLGFTTVITIPTPNAPRVIAPRELADVAGAQVVESYFDLAIRPRPPRGVVLFAPCSFNSLNKLAHGIADNLALSVAAEAIGRATPVVVGPSLNQPLLVHPVAQASLRTLASWRVTIVPPVDSGDGPRLAPTAHLLDAVRRFVRRVWCLYRNELSAVRDVLARCVWRRYVPETQYDSIFRRLARGCGLVYYVACR